MGILENVKVLETKVDKEIDFAKRIIEENVQLKEKVALYQKRIEDLESLIQAFREEQNAIENGILAALNRLNQFEDAVEKKLSPAEEAPEQPQAESPPPDSGAEGPLPPDEAPAEPVLAKPESGDPPAAEEPENPGDQPNAAAG
jgi:chromosome segregation ATPase